MRAIAKKQLCPDIVAGDEVEVLARYNYWMGTNERIEKRFNLKSDEVVVQKDGKNPTNEKAPKELYVAKCKRTDLEFL